MVCRQRNRNGPHRHDAKRFPADVELQMLWPESLLLDEKNQHGAIAVLEKSVAALTRRRSYQTLRTWA